MANLTLVQAINLALIQEMEDDDRVILLGEDIGANGGVFRVTEGLHQRFGRDRVVDTPLAESGIIGTAIGLAMAGLRPVPEIQFEGFLGPAFDQLCNARGPHADPARAARSPFRWTVAGAGGRRHPRPGASLGQPRGDLRPHSRASRWSCPPRPTTPRGCSSARSAIPIPVIFFEPKRIYRAFREEVPEDEYTIPIGKARVVAEGDEMTMISWGAAVIQSMNAIEASGRSIELIDLRTIYPIDVNTITESVKKTGRAVVVHEAPRTAGFGAEIATRIQERVLPPPGGPRPARHRASTRTCRTTSWSSSYLPEADRIALAIEETAAY